MTKPTRAATLLCTAAAFLAGCEPLELNFGPPAAVKPDAKPSKAEPKEAADDTEDQRPPDYFHKTSVQSEFASGGEGAVKEAMTWMQRYTREVEKSSQLARDKRALEDSNRDLTAQVAKLKADLAQARKELDEANAMLLRLNQDLKAWKADVLGYREEMRSRHAQTLAALDRVLKLLGGEPPEAPASPSAPVASKSSTEAAKEGVDGSSGK